MYALCFSMWYKIYFGLYEKIMFKSSLFFFAQHLDCGVILDTNLLIVMMRTNPCCKSPNGNLTHFGTFTCEDFFVGCMLWFICAARPPQRWGSWPMDPRLESRGSNDLGGAMFKGEHIRVHIQACSFYPQAQVRNLAWLEVPPFWFDKRGRKKARAWRPFM